MYIANNEKIPGGNEILAYIPSALRRYMYNIELCGAYEIRMRLGGALTICYPDGAYCLSDRGMLIRNASGALRVTRAHIDEAVELAVKSSMYSAEDEIRGGYITVSGGNRIGICGKTVMNNGKIEFMKDISGLNYRLAHELVGISDKVKESVLTDEGVKNTLIISPPGAGKTTLLRDIARSISYAGYNVSVVDERCEIAAMHEGKTVFDIGPNTDVLSGAPKSDGMLMMLRSMAPDVVVTDEMGNARDAEAAEKAINSGVRLITTVHGSGTEQIKNRGELCGAMRFFETFISLSKRCGAGTVEKIETAEQLFLSAGSGKHIVSI